MCDRPERMGPKSGNTATEIDLAWWAAIGLIIPLSSSMSSRSSHHRSFRGFLGAAAEACKSLRPGRASSPSRLGVLGY